MKNGWLTKGFEDCLEAVDYTRKVPRRKFLAEGKFPIISQEADFINGYWNDSADLFKISRPVIVFGDHTQVVKYIDFDFVLGADGVKVLLPSNFLSPKFLYYYLQAFPVADLGYARHYRLLRALEITYPPLPAQQRIVGLLDEAFAGIATAKANAEKNLQNARALFESHLHSVFTQHGKGWKERPLGTLATFRNGINYTKDSKGELVKIVGVKDFKNSFWVSRDNLDNVTVDGKLNESDALKRGDILAVRSNGNLELIGRTLLAGDMPEKISHSGFTIRIRLTNADVLPQYLCHLMKCAATRKLLVEGGTGTNIKSLNQQTLSALDVPFPPLAEQKALVAKLESLSTETKCLASIYERKFAALEALKKSLLHQAFTGQL
jgi:type I restriction enzyme S subunit